MSVLITISASSVQDLGPRSNPRKLLGSAGQRMSAGDDIIIMPWNDLDTLETLFAARGDEIAAVITEPYMCDEGPIMPKDGYLKGLKALTAQYEILLIFDEVITGFRMALGGAQKYYGVTPDMAVFGKALAGGYSLSMICGKKEVMECGVHPSGTFNATPIAVAAALATIGELSRPGVYQQFSTVGNRLASGLTALGKKHGIKLFAANNGAICQLQLGVDYSVQDFRDCLTHVDTAMYDRLFLACTDYGIRITSARGRLYLSTAHTNEDVDKTMEILDYIFPKIQATTTQRGETP